MHKFQFSELNVRGIKKIIEEEILRRKRHLLGSTGPADQQHDGIHQGSSLGEYQRDIMSGDHPSAAWINQRFVHGELENKQSYAVADFLNFHDEQFVETIYRHILGREPDTQGLAYYLGQLRAGTFNKIEILGRIRYSPEGRARAKRIRGLPGLFGINLLYKIPVAGYFIRLAAGLIQIPTIARNISKMEAYTHWRLSQGEALVNQTLDIVTALQQTKADNAVVSSLAGSVKQLETRKADKAHLDELGLSVAQLDHVKADQEHMEKLSIQIDQLDRAQTENVRKIEAAQSDQLDRIKLLDQNKANNDLVTRLQQQIGPLEWQNVQRQFEELQSYMVDRIRNVLHSQRDTAMLLDEVRKKTEELLANEQIQTILGKDEHILDALLVSFYDVFRGSRDDIKRRQSIYLPIIKQVCAGIEHAQVLDVGCGRGEWLELLQEQQLNGIGIDINGLLVKECTERNLKVIKEEALQYLRQLPPDSIAAVTCFHIIEHLPFSMMIKLFDEAFRAVKTGGVVIFETPNPENLLVGACNFYLDPTHHHPLPPELTKYLLSSRGFARVEIKRLHPYPENSKITGTEPDLINRLNDLLYGFQDYAVIGYKDLDHLA